MGDNTEIAPGPDFQNIRLQKCHSFMRKFWEPRRTQCKTVKEIYTPKIRSEVFPTGSKYEGSMLGYMMDGHGLYTFPNGVNYVGDFKDNQFHGYGELVYKDGTIVRGNWEKGQLFEREIVFPNGLVFEEENWKYCKDPDRRFAVEYKNGIQAAGKSYLTEDQPTRKVPEEYYDSGDGFYHPKHVVVKKQDMVTLVRAPKVPEQNWILTNCRKGTDSSVGPSKRLYKEWSQPQTNLKPWPLPAAHLDTIFDREVNAKSSIFDEHESTTGFGKVRLNQSVSLSKNLES